MTASSTPSYLSFLTFNESLVPIYQFPVYNPTQDSNQIFPYFDEVKVPYPKPGYENPRVGVWVWDFGGWLGAVRGMFFISFFFQAYM
jgi:dipeptidyl aminopeptidase B